MEYFLRGFLLILRLLLKTFSDSGLDGDEEAWEDNFLLFSPGTPDLGLLGIGIDIYRYIQGVSKKTGISVQGSFEALKWPKIKKSKKTNPT